MKKNFICLSVFVLICSLFMFNGVKSADAATRKGGYVYSKYYAAGGRVNIEVHDLYLNVTDARKYAKKSEPSIKEGALWFGAAFIPAAGPYLSTIGFYKSTESAVFASEIRKYTDKNKPVHIILSKDNGPSSSVNGRTVKAWNGKKSSVKPSDSLNKTYRTKLVTKYKGF